MKRETPYSSTSNSSKPKNLEIEESLWNNGHTYIAGVDEAGRGPLAGPVVACACILPKNKVYPGIKDSKELSPKKREALYYELICDTDIVWATSSVDIETIDEINILQATLLAMKQAVESLTQLPDFVLIDGRDSPKISINHKAYVSGDSLSQSIAAASIIAKVIRDEAMDRYHELWPEYGFNKHKGYGTEAHIRAIFEYGPSPIHRRSFYPVSELVSENQDLSVPAQPNLPLKVVK